MEPSTRDQMQRSAVQGAGEMVEVIIPPLGLRGNLSIPPGARVLIVFVHGSGSSRHSPRNRAVAEALNRHAMATLLFDLLTEEEEADRANVFDIGPLAERLIETVGWIDRDPRLQHLPLGLFGASTGAAAALLAAAELGDRIGAIVSRGGRPDLAGPALDKVRIPTLLIVGGEDDVVIELNKEAMIRLKGPKTLDIVPRATHLFPEPGTLEIVMAHAAQWFEAYLFK